MTRLPRLTRLERKLTEAVRGAELSPHLTRHQILARRARRTPGWSSRTKGPNRHERLVMARVGAVRDDGLMLKSVRLEASDGRFIGRTLIPVPKAVANE